MNNSLQRRGDLRVFLAILVSAQLCLQFSQAQTNHANAAAAAPTVPAQKIKFLP